jgi:glycosyltransferase involved in cell wall biosynthesis
VTGTRAHESFGLVVDEALELGMGCLLPNLGAMGERASKVAWATVFESGEAQSLADLLDEVCDSPERVAALREAAICAVLEEDFTARAASQDVLASSVLGVLEEAIQSGVPSAPLAALRKVDWVAREARLQNQNDAWDAALSSS